jgi:site-specific DNA-methyltransferase (cytosine-N4-specific)
METKHKIIFSNSSNMEKIHSKSVNLVVTSPPYPMIEMWDELFSSFNLDIKDALKRNDRMKAYSLMNKELDKVWKEVDRVMADGGIVCINIGDATRKIGDNFQLYANHAHIIRLFEEMNYQVLPMILWRKQSNKPNKFMGSGMLPPNAYVTLEHEYILIFRKSGMRKFNDSERIIRQNSAYFWEERNLWFSDIWHDLKGTSQKLNHKKLRERSAAYPFELAYRLINMYSVQGDTVLDPFLGTGTTTIAAMCSARNSVGFELDMNFKETIELRIDEVESICNELILDRLKNHIDFIKNRELENKIVKHESQHYGFKVITNQEKNILLPLLKKIENVGNNEYKATYSRDVKFELEDNKIETSVKTDKKRVNNIQSKLF